MVQNQVPLLRKPQFGLLLATVAAASMWCYAGFILIPHQRSEAARNGTPRGNLSDLYPRWLGTRELLLHGRDPYSHEITREIQAGYYGRLLDPNRASDPKDQQGFAYPVYVVFVLAPSIRLPFSVVQSAFRLLLVLLTIASVYLWLQALGWQLSVPWKLTLIILALGSFPALQGIKLQQLTLLVCGLLAGCAAAIASGHLVIAGFLLGVATIKPQLAAIFAGWLMLWTFGSWRKRQSLLWSFAATMVILVLGGEALLPGWIGRFRNAANAYWQYTGGGKSVLDLVLGPLAGKIVAGILVLVLAGYCWRARSASAEGVEFRWTLALVCAVTLVVIPTYAPYNQLLLLLPLMAVAESAPFIAAKGTAARLLLMLAALSVLWPWLAALALCAVLPLLGSETVQHAWAVPLYTSLYIPLTVLGATWIGAAAARPRTRHAG